MVRFGLGDQLPRMQKLHLLGLLLLTACGASGTAPEISSLSVAPPTVAIGALETVTAAYDFVDLDGDAFETIIVLRGPDGAEVSMTTPVVGAAGLVSGRVTLQMSIQAPSAGTFTVVVFLRDAEGNDSAPLEAQLTAT